MHAHIFSQQSGYKEHFIPSQQGRSGPLGAGLVIDRLACAPRAKVKSVKRENLVYLPLCLLLLFTFFFFIGPLTD